MQPDTRRDAVGTGPSETKSLKIDPATHRRLKVEAATREMSLQTLTESALMVGLAGLAYTFRYREQTGTVEANPVRSCLHGKLLGIAERVRYEAQTLAELEAAFRQAVDLYLDARACAVQPNRAMTLQQAEVEGDGQPVTLNGSAQ